MRVCGRNPYNFTLIWVIYEVKELFDVYHPDADGFMGGEYAALS